jgi:hypothetical protein
VLVIAGRTRSDSVMIEQLLRLTGVLAGDEINLLQHSNGAQGDVFEIADGCGDEVEARGDWFVRWHRRSVGGRFQSFKVSKFRGFSVSMAGRWTEILETLKL